MIYLFLPAYNEEASLPKLLPGIITEFEKREIEFILVVVNDGSTDGTASILKEYQNNPNVRVITHPVNRGLGETERDGFEALALQSRPEDIIVRIEGDDTHCPSYIFALIEKLREGYDVVNTSRFQKGGGQVGIGQFRAFISYSANVFMKIMLRIKNVRDFSCGFRAYRAVVIQDALRIFGSNFLQLRGLGFTSTLEIIVKLKLLGCRFAEIPFVLRYDKKQSSSKMVGTITTFGYFVMAVLYHWPFGGWRVNYRRLKKLYKEDRISALQEFGLHNYDVWLANK